MSTISNTVTLVIRSNSGIVPYDTGKIITVIFVRKEVDQYLEISINTMGP